MEINEISEKMRDWMNNQPERKIIIRTGVGGFDLFTETMENSAGFERVRIGKKVPRILRRLKTPIKKSPVGYYYKLVRNGKVL